MAIRDLLWACPHCRSFGTLRAGKRRTDVCQTCGTAFERAERATLRITFPDGRTETREAADWELRLPSIESRYPPENDETIGPVPVGVRTLTAICPVRDSGRLIGWAERLSPRAAGTASLSAIEMVVQIADRHESTALADITSIQPSSSSLQIGRRNRPLLSLRFTTVSVRLWEAILQTRMANVFRQAGRGEIIEFQPLVRTHAP